MAYYKPPQQQKAENPNVVGNVLKDTAKAVLPVGAAALGNMLLPGIGGAAAGALTSSIMNNIMANGGPLTEYEGGGTHEQNPNGGIPVGKFLVEEGETNFDNYIFSNRLQLSKDKAKELGFSLGNMSYADASKKIKNKYKGREDDTTAQKSMIKELSRLKEAHEAERMLAMDNDFNEFSKKYGGYLKSNNGKITMALGGPTNLTKTYEQFLKESGYVDNAVAKNAYQQYVKQTQEAINPTGKPYMTLKPGEVNIPQVGPDVETNPVTEYMDFETPQLETPVPEVNLETPDVKVGDVSEVLDISDDVAQAKEDTNFMDQANPYMRMAPVASNLINLYRLTRSKPEMKDANDFMSNVEFEANLVDREQINRDIRQSEATASRNIRDASGGNSARFLASRMGLNTRANQSLAQANMQSDALDAQELARVQNANYTQDANNLRMKLQIEDINDRDLDVYQSAVADQIGLIGQNIGSIGKEGMDRNTANSVFDYMLDKVGKVKYKE